MAIRPFAVHDLCVVDSHYYKHIRTVCTLSNACASQWNPSSHSVGLGGERANGSAAFDNSPLCQVYGEGARDAIGRRGFTLS